MADSQQMRIVWREDPQGNIKYVDVWWKSELSGVLHPHERYWKLGAINFYL